MKHKLFLEVNTKEEVVPWLQLSNSSLLGLAGMARDYWIVSLAWPVPPAHEELCGSWDLTGRLHLL